MNTLQAFNNEGRFKLMLFKNPENLPFFDYSKKHILIDECIKAEKLFCKGEDMFLRFLIDIATGNLNSLAFEQLIMTNSITEQQRDEVIKFSQKIFYLDYTPDKKVTFLDSPYVRFLHSA